MDSVEMNSTAAVEERWRRGGGEVERWRDGREVEEVEKWRRGRGGGGGGEVELRSHSTT